MPIEYYTKLLKNTYSPPLPEKKISFFRAQYRNLITTLDSIEENVLFIAIGNARVPANGLEQQIPTYIKNIASATAVRLIFIDDCFADEDRYMRYAGKHLNMNEFTALWKLKKRSGGHDSSYIQEDNPNVTVDVFSHLLQNDEDINRALTQAIWRVLDKKGRVFIANHTQQFSCTDIPEISYIYNDIKTSHPAAMTGMQLYTQGAQKEVRYYLGNVPKVICSI